MCTKKSDRRLRAFGVSVARNATSPRMKRYGRSGGRRPPFQRVDDSTDRLLPTSTQIGNLACVFLTGTATTTGTQLQIRFAQTGRYLVVCMNRNYFLANWMFGFVSADDN